MYAIFLALLLSAFGALALGAPAEAQRMPPPTSYWETRADYVPESERHPDWYTVAGERDGSSMFPRHRHPEVEYEPGDELTFDRYHTVDVMYHWLWRWEEEHPDIVEIREVGRSFEGRPILQATITNREAGDHTDKPAAYFDGGRHAGEITPSESVLWMMQHILESYGTDPEITELVDTKTLYLRPQHNPDGSNLYLHTAQRNRSSVRPLDQDGDGLVDANPPKDLTGDGKIRQMRWYVGEGEGDHVIDDRDPTGRLMRSVSDGEGDWRVETEAIDHVGDGRYGSDGIGGLDMHRNLLANWRPMPGFDETGRGYTQLGAGEYPLSEPEQYSMTMWMLTHPHISVVNHMDTRVPYHLRPPSTSDDEERMYPEDLELYLRFDSIGLGITGYPGAGNVYRDFRDHLAARTGETTPPVPLFGHGPDFGYWYYGSIWYGDELWNDMLFEDFNEDGLLDDVDRLHWDDEFNEGRCFEDWQPFDHPQLGEVEIGGWSFKFCRQNPPPHLLEEWAENQARFNLALAMHLPHLVLHDPEVRGVEGEGDDGATHELTVRWTNEGGLPTALRQARLVKIVREDWVELRFDDGDRDRVEILDPEEGSELQAGWTEVGETNEVVFRIRVEGEERVAGRALLLSTRGGVHEVPIAVQPGAR